MLRMGKNPSEDKSQTETDSYATRSYSPYQSNEPQARPAADNAATPKVERKENVIDASNAIKVDASKKSEEGSNGKVDAATVTALAR